MWKLGYICSILVGIYIWYMTIVDVVNGYVTIPNRFRDAFQVMPEDGMYCWGVLVMWIVGGGVVVGLGVYGLYEERKNDRRK